MIDLKEIARQELDAINRRDFDKVRKLLHDDFTFTGTDGQKHEGKESGIAVAEFYMQAFPDMHFEIRNMITADNHVIVEYTSEGTHQGELMGIAPTHRKGSVPICTIYEFRDGKIYAERQYFDNAHIMQQLGIEMAHEHV